jgi:hypothetical protein
MDKTGQDGHAQLARQLVSGLAEAVASPPAKRHSPRARKVGAFIN